MAAEGHQVGVHTFDHVMLTDLSRRDYDVQVGRTRALLAQIAGPGDYWLRPPYGITDQAAEQWAASPLILWSVDPEDWKDRDVHRIVSAVTEHVKDGDIILRLEGEDAQKPEGYVPVEDEGIAQAVYDIFHLKNMSSFDFQTYLEGE